MRPLIVDRRRSGGGHHRGLVRASGAVMVEGDIPITAGVDAQLEVAPQQFLIANAGLAGENHALNQHLLDVARQSGRHVGRLGPAFNRKGGELLLRLGAVEKRAHQLVFLHLHRAKGGAAGEVHGLAAGGRTGALGIGTLLAFAEIVIPVGIGVEAFVFFEVPVVSAGHAPVVGALHKIFVHAREFPHRTIAGRDDRLGIGGVGHPQRSGVGMEISIVGLHIGGKRLILVAEVVAVGVGRRRAVHPRELDEIVIIAFGRERSGGVVEIIRPEVVGSRNLFAIFHSGQFLHELATGTAPSIADQVVCGAAIERVEAVEEFVVVVHAVGIGVFIDRRGTEYPRRARLHHQFLDARQGGVCIHDTLFVGVDRTQQILHCGAGRIPLVGGNLAAPGQRVVGTIREEVDRTAAGIPFAAADGAVGRNRVHHAENGVGVDAGAHQFAEVALAVDRIERVVGGDAGAVGPVGNRRGFGVLPLLVQFFQLLVHGVGGHKIHILRSVRIDARIASSGKRAQESVIIQVICGQLGARRQRLHRIGQAVVVGDAKNRSCIHHRVGGEINTIGSCLGHGNDGVVISIHHRNRSRMTRERHGGVGIHRHNGHILAATVVAFPRRSGIVVAESADGGGEIFLPVLETVIVVVAVVAGAADDAGERVGRGGIHAAVASAGNVVGVAEAVIVHGVQQAFGADCSPVDILHNREFDTRIAELPHVGQAVAVGIPSARVGTGTGNPPRLAVVFRRTVYERRFGGISHTIAVGVAAPRIGRPELIEPPFLDRLDVGDGRHARIGGGGIGAPEFVSFRQFIVGDSGCDGVAADVLGVLRPAVAAAAATRTERTGISAGGHAIAFIVKGSGGVPPERLVLAVAGAGLHVKFPAVRHAIAIGVGAVSGDFAGIVLEVFRQGGVAAVIGRYVGIAVERDLGRILRIESGGVAEEGIQQEFVERAELRRIARPADRFELAELFSHIHAAGLAIGGFFPTRGHIAVIVDEPTGGGAKAGAHILEFVQLETAPLVNLPVVDEHGGDIAEQRH